MIKLYEAEKDTAIRACINGKLIEFENFTEIQGDVIRVGAFMRDVHLPFEHPDGLPRQAISGITDVENLLQKENIFQLYNQQKKEFSPKTPVKFVEAFLDPYQHETMIVMVFVKINNYD